MTRKTLSLFAVLLLTLTTMVSLGTPAHAATLPVVPDQDFTYNLTWPQDYTVVTATSDGGEALTIDCVSSTPGDFVQDGHVGLRYFLEFERAWVTTGGNYSIACTAKNSAGTVPFNIRLSVVGEYTTGTYQSVYPLRALDTRTWGYGALGPGDWADVKFTGWDGIPINDVAAIVANVTVVEPTRNGVITAYPTGGAIPTASNLNFAPLQIVPNLVTVQLNGEGWASFVNQSSGNSHLIVDVVGYYTGPWNGYPADAPSAAGAFKAFAPTRVMDTRSGIGGTRGPVAPGGTVTIALPGQPGAAVMNVTVTDAKSNGFITVFPAGGTPATSNVNYGPGRSSPTSWSSRPRPTGRSPSRTHRTEP